MAEPMLSISLHNTPKHVYDSLALDEERPERSISTARWKTLDVQGVQIIFFKPYENDKESE
jgi:hypothetical protein